MSDLGERVPVLIYDGINVIADDRIPEGYIGIDGAFGLELIRIDVNYVESDVPDTTKLVARAVYTSPQPPRAAGEDT